MAACGGVDEVWMCSWVSIHVHRRPFDVQDGAGDGKRGGGNPQFRGQWMALSHPHYRVNSREF